MREHACLNALISSDVRSYLVGDNLCGSERVSRPVSRSRAGSEPWENVGVRKPLVRGEEEDESAGETEAEGSMGGVGGGVDVAMTRKVVRSKRMTSVALHACASVVRCLERTAALGMRVCTIRDHA